MKKILFLLVILIFSGRVEAQEENRATGKNILAKEIVATGDAISFGGISVRFMGVVSDSRCPESVQCIWSGEAKVLLAFNSGDGSVNEVEVVIPSSAVQALPFLKQEGLELNIFGLSPYPKTPHGIPAEDYRLAMQIRELSGD